MKARLLAILVVMSLLLPGARAFGQGDTSTGTINDDTPFVKIPIQVAEDGTTIIADIQATSGDLDTLLYLVDSAGIIVAENDDRVKRDTNSLLVFPQADAGQYTLVVTRYKVAEGDSSGDYQLTIELVRESETERYQVADSDLAAAGFPAIEPRPQAEWTILAYYGGDNNLEPGILNDFDEFEVAGGSDEQVRIVALVDRVPGFTDSSGDWTTARLFEIEPDRTGDHGDTYPPTLDSEPLADLGEVDTGNGQTLAQFLVWAIRHYPSQHYVIAFGSHGAGWQGLITDDTADTSILTIPELQQAFALALAEAGMTRFDLLINDACLMSSIEYFAGLSDYFKFALASPEIVVDPALDMTRFVELLEHSQGLNLRVIGRELVDTYILRDILKRDSSDVPYLTHAVTDLTRFDPVVEAVEGFAKVINRSPAVYATLLGEARANAYTYTGFLGGDTKIDLGSLMRRVMALSTDSAVIAAAEDVLIALDGARVYGNAGENVLNRTHYYNIYFPDTSADFKLTYFEESPLPEWGKMLRNYYNAVTPQVWSGAGLELGFHLPTAPKIEITNVYPATAIDLMSRVDLRLEIVGRRISYGDFTVDQVQPDGSAIRLSTERVLTDVLVDGEFQRFNQWRPGVEVSRYYWDVELPVVTDGVHRHNELLIFTEDVVFLDGRYREPGSETWNDVGVIFNLDGDVQRIVNHAANSDALAVVDIATGAEFQAYSSVVTPDGRVTAEPGQTYTWPEDGLTWEWEPASNGDYNLGLLITAFGGTTGFASATVTVDNSHVPPGLRGDTWLDVGVTLPRPAAWTWSAFSPEEFLIRSTSPDKSENITLYFVAGVGDDLATIAEGFAGGYGRTLSGDLVESEIAGAPALELDFSYETEAGAYDGHGFAFFHPTLGIGMVAAAEALAGAGETAPAAGLLREHLVLIDLAAVYQADTTVWDFAVAEDHGLSLEYPVRLDWLDGFEDGLWTRYTPGADPASPTFAATTFGPSAAADAGAALDALLTAEVMAGAEDFETTDRRTYYGQSHTWEAALYEAERDGQAVIGRLYVTLFEGAQVALWAETPDTEEAATIFADIFEPMLDGYLITATEA